MLLAPVKLSIFIQTDEEILKEIDDTIEKIKASVERCERRKCEKIYGCIEN